MSFREGHRFGLATAALALSVVSFLNMLGFEKSLLAMVLAVLAMRGAAPVSAAFRRGRTALVIAAVHFVTIAVLLVLFYVRYHDKLPPLLQQLLQKLH
jgi:hypothetical protein